MRPLIFEYVETPSGQNLDFSLIEYCDTKNLSVIKGTDIPAISSALCDTVTHTKASIEASDNDADIRVKMKLLMDTQTVTLVKTEGTDGDNNFTNLRMLMDTQTLTESKENTDRDR